MVLHTPLTELLEMPLEDLYEYNGIVEEVIAEMYKPRNNGWIKDYEKENNLGFKPRNSR